MLLSEIALTSTEVGWTSSRRAKVERLSACLAALTPDEVPVAVAYLSGRLPQGSIGVGWASIKVVPAAATPPANPRAARGGRDPAPRRRPRRRGLAGGAARGAPRPVRPCDRAPSSAFLRGLLTGEIRQGALEGVMVDAVARAADLPAARGPPCRDARGRPRHGRRRGARGQERGARRVPALAAHARSSRCSRSPPRTSRRRSQRSAPRRSSGRSTARGIQIHRLGDEVRVFTRNLADVTERVPEIVEAIARARRRGGRARRRGRRPARRRAAPRAFGVTMSRFGSRSRAASTRSGRRSRSRHSSSTSSTWTATDLIDLPASERFAALEARLPEELRVPRIVTDDAAEADRFLDDALARGHEGVMVKALDAPYEAGRRGAGWLKVKRAHTLDLVVLAAEWGHGRRRGWLSNLHLGAARPRVGRLRDARQDVQGHDRRDARAGRPSGSRRSRRIARASPCYVRPELVVEVAFDGLQPSTRYPGGVALRFARVKGYRPDKRAEDADTIETVRARSCRSP